MTEDISAVKKFEKVIYYKKEGTPVSLYVEALVDGKNVYQGNATCYISYNVGYMQYSVMIDWSFPDKVMSDLGLHGSYSTNFQRMKVEQDALVITGDNYRIKLWKE